MSYQMPAKESNSHGSNSNLQLLHDGEGLDYRMKTVNKNGGKKEISLWHDVTLVHIDPATNKPTVSSLKRLSLAYDSR